jgi:hypothetical protein
MNARISAGEVAALLEVDSIVRGIAQVCEAANTQHTQALERYARAWAMARNALELEADAETARAGWLRSVLADLESVLGLSPGERLTPEPTAADSLTPAELGKVRALLADIVWEDGT